MLQAAPAQRVVDERAHRPDAPQRDLLQQDLDVVAEQERDGVPRVEALRAPERRAAVGLALDLCPGQRALEGAERRAVGSVTRQRAHDAGHAPERRVRQAGRHHGERASAPDQGTQGFQGGEHAPIWHARHQRRKRVGPA